MKLFAQIAKVDEEKRLVFGRIAEEKVDKSDEIMDYLSSKPHFQKWSSDIAADTDGKNLGNVRAMHGKVAAGALTKLSFNDGEKAIDVCAKISDDNEWKKVLDGVYTGFSIGGAYVGEKKVEKADGRDVTRYTAKPSEVSLVDRPCMPGAKFFEVQKADGSLQKVEFEHQPAEEIEPVEVVGTEEEIVKLGKLMNETGMTMGELLEKAFPDNFKKKPKPGDKGAAIDDAAHGKDPNGAAATDDGDGDDDAACAAKIAKMETEIGELRKGGPKSVAMADALQKTVDELKKPAAVEKLDTAALQKMMTDAVTAAVAPLQKSLDEAKAELEVIKKQPAPARVSLRAVAKADDLGSGEAAPTERELIEKLSVPLIDDRGDKHEAAGLIKGLHASRGAPLNIPNSR